jgi:hypothetical protein
MNVRNRCTSGKRREGGYALLLVVFLTTMLLIATMAVAPNALTEGKREREKEMIWRGKQYVRGVKLHYRKLGRFPTSLDDLTKPKIGSLRFMRQAYKDPMNHEDGSWRLIYVGPLGQLIGSLKPSQSVQFGRPGGLGMPPTPLGGTGTTGQLGNSDPLGAPANPGGTSAGGGTSGTNPTDTTGTPVSADQSDSGANPQPASAGNPSPIIGGNIIGVGSKINQRSVIMYEHAKNYQLFEFVWDPSRDNLAIGQPGLQTGTGLGQVPGQSPFGQQPGLNPPNPPPPLPQNPQQ